MREVVWTVECGGPGLVVPGYENVNHWDNTFNESTPCSCYDQILKLSSGIASPPEILIYIHDDVTIHDPDWLTRVLEPFSRPDCVAVGLGGALSLGHPDLYKRPYRIQDLARGGYRSNQTDWQTHGEQETGSCRVAVLDAFFMAVRRNFLVKVGGWPVKHLTHHCLDLWLACEAAKHKKETWQVGVSVTHHGGGSSTKPAYREAKWLLGGSMEIDHQEPHRWLYETYRDVLPIKAKS